MASTFGQIVLFWGFFLAVIPFGIAALDQRWAVAFPFPSFAAPVGFAVLVLASALGISAAIAMSTLGDGTPLPSAMPNHLVIAGPYRWIRNPGGTIRRRIPAIPRRRALLDTSGVEDSALSETMSSSVNSSLISLVTVISPPVW
ncbi:hypothetical protein [Arthrobacter sp. efr-133-TYG-118]|uniref:hypothetical protein n=1 Tax=Arthrobacter sp. efr-133-TYG-118 TaxID=3040279 RepID=UPI003305E832